MFTCPNCGKMLKVIPLASGGGGWERGQSFAMGAPPAGAEYSRETPTADVGNLEAGLRLPLGQAIVTATAGAALDAAACWYWGWSWAWVPVAWVITFGGAWYLLLLQSRRLLTTRETVTSDPGATDPAFSVSVEITDTTDGRRQMRFAQFEAKPEDVRRFAEAVLHDRLTPSGARLSRRKFDAIRNEAIARGLVAWRNPEAHAQGLEANRAGRAVFSHLLDCVG